jgi:hypothetical protein
MLRKLPILAFHEVPTGLGAAGSSRADVLSRLAALARAPEASFSGDEEPTALASPPVSTSGCRLSVTVSTGGVTARVLLLVVVAAPVDAVEERFSSWSSAAVIVAGRALIPRDVVMVAVVVVVAATRRARRAALEYVEDVHDEEIAAVAPLSVESGAAPALPRRGSTAEEDEVAAGCEAGEAFGVLVQCAST